MSNLLVENKKKLISVSKRSFTSQVIAWASNGISATILIAGQLNLKI
jgi:hypothetical protein